MLKDEAIQTCKVVLERGKFIPQRNEIEVNKELKSMLDEIIV